MGDGYYKVVFFFLIMNSRNKIKLVLYIPIYLIALFFLVGTNIAYAVFSWPGDSGSVIGDADNLGAGYEPSGAVWHSRLKQLIIVGDDGDVTKMNSDGSNIVTWHPGRDLEGVTIADSSSRYIYLGIENPDSIKEFSLTSGKLTGKSWDLTEWMKGPANSGLEALTFVPNDRHPYHKSSSGGLFYAGLQDNGKIYVFDINLSKSGKVKYIATITPKGDYSDISGLDYNEETKVLYAIFDSNNKLVEMKPNGEVIVEYTLPGNNQEGIAVVVSTPSATAQMYIAEDSPPFVKKYSILNKVPLD